MNPRMASLVVCAWLVACGGSELPQLSYAGWSERVASSACAYEARCGALTVSREQCEADVIAAYAAVEPDLSRTDTGAKAGCVQCMRVRIDELDAAVASGCQQAPDEARLRASCGVDDAACMGVP
ncbi:hypothetical protein [Corallococcus macrosporus]|uniref:Lipoprotein n=1 Tax=Corallococcus macrosporus DSM 14697 TaxID=1189310 RepID=A0A286NVR7_9BACT|nr:hypothetical protein [Corallococcus macrosporus]ATB51262.1 hypothetical protein MYMAC_006920 [Corallococcus macrosporus DSM 14697]